MSLKLNGSSGGSVSFDAPSNTSPSGTDVTLTLPTSAGSAGQYLRNSSTAGTLEFADGGKILQVVQGTTNTEVSASNTDWVEIGLSASITAKAANSKFLVLVVIQGRVFRSTGDNGASARILRNINSASFSSIHADDNNYGWGYQSNMTNIEMSHRVSYNYLDSPSASTGDVLVYKIEGRNRTSGGTNRVDFQNNDDFYSTIQVLEVQS